MISVSYVHADALGTSRAVTDGSGAAIWSWSNSTNPFGERAPVSAGYVFNLRFPGQYFDVESALHYNAHRNYEAASGRFLQSDPIGLFGGVTTFGYAGANPLRNIDPEGLAVKCTTIAKLPGFDLQSCEEDGSNPSPQDAKDAKRMSGDALDKACRNNGYDDAHAMKRDLGLGSDRDIFVDGNGNLYSGPRQGTGAMEYLHLNSGGW